MHELFGDVTGGAAAIVVFISQEYFVSIHIGIDGSQDVMVIVQTNGGIEHGVGVGVIQFDGQVFREVGIRVGVQMEGHGVHIRYGLIRVIRVRHNDVHELFGLGVEQRGNRFSSGGIVGKFVTFAVDE